MGFRLYTKNGIFNPVAYGLRPGSDIFVAAIGGGGGSGRLLVSTTDVNDYDKKNGGAGGPSSFGSYLTAKGGSGGGATVYKGTNYSVPSPTSGGLIPELLHIQRDRVVLSLSDVFFPGPFVSTMMAKKRLTSGGTYAFCLDQAGAAGSEYLVLPKYITDMNGTEGTVTGVGMIDKGNEIISQSVKVRSGNAYLVKDTNYMRGGACATLYTHITSQDWVNPTSGIGYGAGGVGFVRYHHEPGNRHLLAYSGATPTPVMGFITLETLEEIAVTVGGGGASGGWDEMSGTVSGITTVNSGTAGAAGKRDSKYTYSADGGYGDKAPGYGAGAGGCVAVWW